MSLSIGSTVNFAGHLSLVRDVAEQDGRTAYLIENGPQRLPMWVPEEILEAHQDLSRPQAVFESQTPTLLIVDEFFRDPNEVREIALAQSYVTEPALYKGLRTTERFLWPQLREEFGRLLGAPVTRWLEHAANGCFQQTNHGDPLVWHHDDQQYAAAVYLTPDAPPSAGTSFWRHKTTGIRRAPSHRLEARKLGSTEAVTSAEAIVYDPYNFEHEESWELVESVAGLYNRLVIWDAKLFHSATSYDEFTDDSVAPMRLVQLFFFDL